MGATPTRGSQPIIPMRAVVHSTHGANGARIRAVVPERVTRLFSHLSIRHQERAIKIFGDVYAVLKEHRLLPTRVWCGFEGAAIGMAENERGVVQGDIAGILGALWMRDVSVGFVSATVGRDSVLSVITKNAFLRRIVARDETSQPMVRCPQQIHDEWKALTEGAETVEYVRSGHSKLGSLRHIGQTADMAAVPLVQRGEMLVDVQPYAHNAMWEFFGKSLKGTGLKRRLLDTLHNSYQMPRMPWSGADAGNFSLTEDFRVFFGGLNLVQTGEYTQPVFEDRTSLSTPAQNS